MNTLKVHKKAHFQLIGYFLLTTKVY